MKHHVGFLALGIAIAFAGCDRRHEPPAVVSVSYSKHASSQTASQPDPAATLPADHTVTVKSYPHGRREAKVITWNNESALVVKVDGQVVYETAFFDDGDHGYSIMGGAWSASGDYFAFQLASAGGHQPYRHPVNILKVKGAASTLIDAEDVITKIFKGNFIAVSHEDKPYIKWLSDTQLQVNVVSSDKANDDWVSEMYVIDVVTLKAKKQPQSAAPATASRPNE